VEIMAAWRQGNKIRRTDVGGWGERVVENYRNAGIFRKKIMLGYIFFNEFCCKKLLNS